MTPRTRSTQNGRLYQLFSSDRGTFVLHEPCSLRGGHVLLCAMMLRRASPRLRWPPCRTRYREALIPSLPVFPLNTYVKHRLISSTPILTTLETRIQSTSPSSRSTSQGQQLFGLTRQHGKIRPFSSSPKSETSLLSNKGRQAIMRNGCASESKPWGIIMQGSA